MVSFSKTLAAIPDRGGRLVYGTAFWDGSQWWANVGGNLLGARWLDPIVPAQGDKIAVLLSSEGAGQSNALVIGGYTDQPRPSSGTVLTVGLNEIVVTGSFGGTFTTGRFVNPYVPGDTPRYTYLPGDPVHLAWDAATPTILGITSTPVTVPPAASQPEPFVPGSGTGTNKAPATRTNTFQESGGWGSHAGSEKGGQQLYAGTWAGIAVTAAWFYGDAFTGLKGRTITAIRFWVPGRLNVGAPGDTTMHLYAHTSKTEPDDDVDRVAGPANFDLTQTQGGHWINLPLSFAPHLIAGGGIALAGEPYIGLTGRLKDPESGRIEMDWTL